MQNVYDTGHRVDHIDIEVLEIESIKTKVFINKKMQMKVNVENYLLSAQCINLYVLQCYYKRFAAFVAILANYEQD